MDIVFAKTTAQVGSGGRPVMVRQGTHWRANDPLVVNNPSLFSDDPRYGLNGSADFPDDGVEQATAGPGERRQLTGRRGQ